MKMIMYSPLEERCRAGKIFVCWDVHKVIFSFEEKFIFQVDSPNYEIIFFLVILEILIKDNYIYKITFINKFSNVHFNF